MACKPILNKLKKEKKQRQEECRKREKLSWLIRKALIILKTKNIANEDKIKHSILTLEDSYK